MSSLSANCEKVASAWAESSTPLGALAVAPAAGCFLVKESFFFLFLFRSRLSFFSAWDH